MFSVTVPGFHDKQSIRRRAGPLASTLVPVSRTSSPTTCWCNQHSHVRFAILRQGGRDRASNLSGDMNVSLRNHQRFSCTAYVLELISTFMLSKPGSDITHFIRNVVWIRLTHGCHSRVTL
jgi:hypothetical protein